LAARIDCNQPAHFRATLEMMGAGRLRIACFVAFLLGGCIHDHLTQCDDLVCPGGMTCVPLLHGCYSSEQMAPCAGKSDGDQCAYSIITDGVCRSSVCVPASCGDGLITPPEQCDGDELGGRTCVDRGFYRPDGLACRADCTFDVTACSGRCGDGVIDPSEQCELGVALSQTCESLGYYETVTGPACTPICTLDETGCTGFCGDGVVNGPETCDAAPPAGLSCMSLGFDWGAIGCTNRCLEDALDCRPIGFRFNSGTWMLSMWTAGPQLSVGTPADYSGIWLSTDGGLSWTVIARPEALHGVRGLDAKHVWAVGETAASDGGRTWYPPVALFFNGVTWQPLCWDPPAPPATPPPGCGNGMLESGEDCDDGNMISGDGCSSACRYEAPPCLWPYSFFLADVWAAAPDDVYAIGLDGRVWHFNGTSISLMASLPMTSKAIWGSAPNDIWVVGSTMMRYDGTNWTEYTDTALACHDPNVLAACDACFSSGGTVCNGVNPTDCRSCYASAIAIDGTGPDNVFILDDDNDVHYWNGSWFPRARVPHNLTTGINAGANKAQVTDVAAVGDGLALITSTVTNGPPDDWGLGLWRFDATDGLAPIHTQGDGMHFRQISAAGNFIVASLDPYAMTYAGMSWTTTTPPTDLSAIWAASATNVIGVGKAGSVVRHTGSDWTTSWTGLPPASAADLYAVSGAGAKVLAVGNAGTIVTISDSSVSSLASGTSAALRGVQVFDDGTAVAVGDAGTVLAFDGAAWSTLSPPNMPPDLLAVWGSSVSDFWVGGATGAAGVILHYQKTGATQTWISSATEAPVTAVWGAGTRVFAVSGSQLLDYDGAWHASNAIYPMHTLFGMSADDVFASGDAGALFHYDGQQWAPFRSRASTPPSFVAGFAVKHAVMFAYGGGVDVLERLAR
jgi:cysteine-rich repeat protein